MGYTHFWYLPEGRISDDNWEEYSECVKTIVEPHIGGCIGNLVVNENIIAFAGSPAHETFSVRREQFLDSWQTKNSRVFNFCKTAQKPYDKIVTACLTKMKSVFKDDVKISSDGEADDWATGFGVANASKEEIKNLVADLEADYDNYN